MFSTMGFPSKDEDNQGWKLYLTSLIMILAAGLIVIARVVIRLQIGVKLQLDDYTIIASLVSRAHECYIIVHAYLHLASLSMAVLWRARNCCWLRDRDGFRDHFPVCATTAVLG